jgi:putative PEP-CTERM system TPR-repeat lipoprotein
MLRLDQARKLVDQFGATRLNQAAADASLQTSLAAAQSSLGNTEAAESALKAALAADPNHVPALMLLARQKVTARDTDGALLTMNDILTKAPGNAEAWKLKGDILLYAKGKTDDALTAYGKSVEANPKFELGHLAIVAILLQENKLDEASVQLEKLGKFSPNTLEFKFAKAQLAYQKNDLKQAKELTEELLRLVSNNPRFLQLAGAVELQTNSLAQAEIYLTRANEADPQNKLSQRLLISVYTRSGQSARALNVLKSVTTKEGLDPSFYSLAGEVYLQNGDSKTAESYFAKALEIDPGDVPTLTALALTHLSSGRSESSAFDHLEGIAGSTTATNADMALINLYMLRMDFTKALEAVAKLEAKQPGRPIAANLRGRIQLAQNDKVSARKSFEQSLVIEPSYFEATANLATLDMVEKKPEDAKKRFEALLAKNPKNGQALLGLAQIAAFNGDSKAEIAALTKAAEANPGAVAPRMLLIDAFLRDKDTKQALIAAQNASAAQPDNPELLSALGRTQQISGDANQAISTYKKLIALQPLSPQPHIRLAEAYVANKDAGAAEQSLRKALQIAPDTLDAQRGLVLLLVTAQKYKEAIVVAKTIQTQRPNDDVGLTLEGDIAAARKDWSAAITAYQAAADKSKSPANAINLHAAITSAGRKDEAARFAETWSRGHPNDAIFLSYLGSIAISRSDFMSAEKHYLAVLRLQPDNVIALNNLAWVTNQLGHAGALAYAEKANQLAPNQPNFMDTMATLLSASGEHAKAIVLQRKALELQPNDTALRLNLAKMLLASGDKKSAKTELDALAKLGDKSPGSTEVAALLKTL